MVSCGFTTCSLLGKQKETLCLLPSLSGGGTYIYVIEMLQQRCFSLKESSWCFEGGSYLLTQCFPFQLRDKGCSSCSWELNLPGDAVKQAWESQLRVTVFLHNFNSVSKSSFVRSRDFRLQGTS